MAGGSRAHAPALGAFRSRGTETGRERAHCASNLCALPGISGQSRCEALIAVLGPELGNPSFPDGICWAAMAFRA